MKRDGIMEMAVHWRWLVNGGQLERACDTRGVYMALLTRKGWGSIETAMNTNQSSKRKRNAATHCATISLKIL